VILLAVIVALVVLVKPLPEPPHPTFTPPLRQVQVSQIEVPAQDDAEAPTSAPSATPTGTSTPTPTHTPTPTPIASPTPMPTDTPTPVPTVTPETGLLHTPTATAPSPTPVPLAGRVEQRTYASATAGGEQRYRIYLPPGYDETDQRYPVLYLLHGWPYDEAHWDGLGANQVADAGIQAGTWPPFIIVLPGGGEYLYVGTSGGDQSFEGQVILDLMPHVDATYRTWGNREGRAIGGISRGGVWALEIAFMHPDLFAAVGGHSPALSLNLAPPPYDPFYLLVEPGVASLRIYLDAGDADWARTSTQGLHEALDKQGIAHEYVVRSGTHANDLWAANIAEYLAFYASGW
jgi:enterochelin esterase-like enzyme